MSSNTVTYTDFSSRLRGYGIEILAEGPDDTTAKIFIEGSEIRQFYDLNPAAFLEKYGDDANTLCELMSAVKGIRCTEIN